MSYFVGVILLVGRILTFHLFLTIQKSKIWETTVVKCRNHANKLAFFIKPKKEIGLFEIKIKHMAKTTGWNIAKIPARNSFKP